MSFGEWFACYLVLINVITFILFGIDKWKAKYHKWRISERTLFVAALLGGSFGARLGMYMFRHKTKHRSFTIGIPLIFLAQCVLILAGYWFWVIK